jgi:ABC-type glycerol-3-phosphate transport system substrate-binding protein
MLIDRDVPIPAYYQLKQLLKEQIQQGRLKPGDQIPTEAELCARYQLSRTPVRQALLDLTAEGLLVRMPGRGTFVRQPAEPAESALTLRAIVSDERWRDLLDHAAALWNRANPAAPIRLEITLMPLRDLRSALITAVGHGEAPDISFLDSVWVAEFASRHYLCALPEGASAQAIDGDAFFPALMAANRYAGALYGLPISTNVSVLWYRRDWFAAEGLAPPATWAELLAAGQHFRQQAVRAHYRLGPHPIVLVGGRAGGEATTYQCLPFVWAAGGELIRDGAITLNSAQTRAALSFLTNLVRREQLVSPEAAGYAWDQAAAVFAQGGAALALGGTYESFFIRAHAGWDEATFLDRVGFVPIPAGPGGQPAALMGGNSFVIYRQSQAAAQAQAFLKLVSADAVLRPFGSHPAHHSPLLSALEPGAASDPFLAQVAPLLRVARSRPALPDYARVSEQFQLLVEDCLSGRRGVGQAISRTAELIAAITGLPLVTEARG